MRQLVKKPVFIIWVLLLLLSLFLLASQGLKYGVDFSGGTAFQIVLEEPVPAEDFTSITSVISRRLDWAGLKDIKVTPSGNQYIVAQIAESDADEISNLKSLLLKQGKFEAILDGETLFIGEDIKTIYKDPARGYGALKIDSSGNSQWTLPFLLSSQASKKFAEMTFHKCEATGFDSQLEYDCAKTYFFVDRPVNSIIIMDNDLYLEEENVPISPDRIETSYIPIDELISQINTNYYVVDSNLSDVQISELQEDFNIFKKAIVASTVSNSVIEELKNIGYKVEIRNKPENEPWIWNITGLKSIISLTENVTNMNAPTIESPKFQTFSILSITGGASSVKEAQEKLANLEVILESGSLPIPIESISTESISPNLGSEFLNNSLLIGLFALLTVAIVLFIRYRIIRLTIPILLAGASEIFILLGILSLMNFRLDLAAVAGILATIGTGVDHEIIITDSIFKRKNKKENDNDDHDVHESLLSKIKNSFFIVFAAASTTMATMIPVIFFNVGLSKLVGFAITIILGTLIGIIVTRPLYAEFAKKIISKIK
jgi:preprotein translocase subunit SecD